MYLAVVKNILSLHVVIKYLGLSFNYILYYGTLSYGFVGGLSPNISHIEAVRNQLSLQLPLRDQVS